jgi:Methyltransferase domain
MKSFLNCLFIKFLRLLPTRLGHHLMFLLHSDPETTDRWGYHIRAINYYDPVPDFREITAEKTRQRREIPAINFDLPGQLALTQELATLYGGELARLANTPEAEGGFPFQNEYFSFLDAAYYYTLIRHLKPARVVEIGCGLSTRIADKALKANRSMGHPGKLVCIEPYPQPRLTEYNLEMELIEKRVEEIPLDFFSSLAANDILFIDSSHAVKFQSDVCREFLDILPVIQPGVWVHVHDIFFPTDYPARWLIDQRIAFNEQYLLEAFLAFNPYFKPTAALRWLWLDHRSDLNSCWPGEVLPPEEDLGAASFWIKRNS